MKNYLIIFNIFLILIKFCQNRECPFQLKDAPSYCTLSSDCLKTICHKYGYVFSIFINCNSTTFDVSLNKKIVRLKMGESAVLKENFFNLIVDFVKIDEYYKFTIYRSFKWCFSKKCYKIYYENYIRSSIQSLCKDQYDVSNLARTMESQNLTLSSLFNITDVTLSEEINNETYLFTNTTMDQFYFDIIDEEIPSEIYDNPNKVDHIIEQFFLGVSLTLISVTTFLIFALLLMKIKYSNEVSMLKDEKADSLPLL
ncbi:hypothetical protein MXB_1215 [Myxobolus squamalis]|nr:hypothetical protein MXB_1215 [Myxobolus squamalis]